ncbi:hypothetical protein HOM13_00110 [Candidatus Woesearchaeota archaeon]|jgi:small subunit ribosomal protein S3Ae|nr:hypothetical protein [Candidatus Woesearchaeota archaeon]MBT5215123.1 hypothetical protein [Candidatus Woesearchaeota archaeon]MBT6402685.1 hypothetical protein [Candidatus Woesearchaeota archaeon]
MAKKNKSSKKGIAKPKPTMRKKVSNVRRKKKKWFSILAPKEFNNRVIGETFANEPGEMVGRALNVNLMNLLNDYKRQGVNLKFKIRSVNDDNAVCQTVGYSLLKSHSRRAVRKGTDKMDDSFVTETKDGQKMRIKPMIITRHRVSISVVSDIRRKASVYLQEKIKELDSVDVFESVIQTKLQRELRGSLLKTCPIGACEIRSLELIE